MSSRPQQYRARSTDASAPIKPAAAAAAASSPPAAAPASSASSVDGGAAGGPADLVAEFCALTGMGAPEKNNNQEFATSFLDGHDWQLESAVNAYLEMKADEAGGGVGGGGDGPPPEDDVRAPLPDTVDQLYEDPIYDPRAVMSLRLQGLGRDHMLGLGGRTTRSAGLPAQQSSIDPFRNFSDEQQASRMAASATRQRPESQAKTNAKLSALFKPPDELIYVSPSGDSSFDAASEHALASRKWLLINVQQGDEFSSHQLNRDVWNEASIHQLVKSNFIFCQPNHNTSSGMRYQNLYRPPSIPSIAIIDPITKQKVWDVHTQGGKEIRVGKKLIAHIKATLQAYAAKSDLALAITAAPEAADEDTRMLQAAIDASLAGSPASSPVRSSIAAASSSAPACPSGRSATARSLITDLTRPAAAVTHPFAPAAAASSASPSGKGVSSAIAIDDDSEDEYVQIIDSDVEFDAAQGDADSAYEPEEDDDGPPAVLPLAATQTTQASDEHKAAGDKRKRAPDSIATDVKPSKVARPTSTATPSATAAPSPAAPHAALTAPTPVAAVEPPMSIPPEPPLGGPNVCRLQIRMPGGKPIQRRFSKDDPIKHVYAFTRSLLEADSQGKPFLLVSALPRRELKDTELSIAAHGVANSSVILEWI